MIEFGLRNPAVLVQKELYTQIDRSDNAQRYFGCYRLYRLLDKSRLRREDITVANIANTCRQQPYGSVNSPISRESLQPLYQSLAA
jgi:hypothetical protein